MFPLNLIFALQNAADHFIPLNILRAGPNPHYRPYTNQRKIRINRRRAHAAGHRTAFAA